uniref:CCT domain-containing protein n=1 Tax=Oryza nivara TaxID=4536 RepID=A0A0E0HNQ4_ORYNI
MSSTAKAAAAGAVGAKSARACDGCLRRRARWYCAADDAFLCQGCDTSVHSANPLARRHERLRLRPSSPPPLVPPSGSGRRDEAVPAAWFKRKARTPRSHAAKSAAAVGQLLSRRLVVVPEAAAGSGGDSPEERKDEGEIVEEQEQLLYRVPIFDPALSEFCSPPPLEDAAAAVSCCNEDGAVENPTKPSMTTTTATTPPLQFFPDGQANFGPTDAELREFAADMEALLGRGLDDGNDEDSFCMETLGLIEPVDDDAGRVKVEADGDAGMTLAWCHELDTETSSGEMLDIDFDCGSPQAATTPDEKVGSSGPAAAAAAADDDDAQLQQSNLALSLNYEAIIESWGTSPWTDGERPHVKLDDSWPRDYSGVWMAAAGVFGHGGEEQALTPRLGMDGGREARVSRYREKRRTRLFSKKIRYEVRKLNAEKRPRMKGRFVKRAAAAATAAVATACVA